METKSVVASNEGENIEELLLIPDNVMQERIARGDWVRRGDLPVEDVQSIAHLPDAVRSLQLATRKYSFCDGWHVENIARGQGQKVFSAAFVTDDSGPKNTAERRDQLMDSLAQLMFSKLTAVSTYSDDNQGSMASVLSRDGEGSVWLKFEELEALGIALRSKEAIKYLKPEWNDNKRDSNLSLWMRDFLQPKLSLLLRDFTFNGERPFEGKEFSLVVGDCTDVYCHIELYSYDKDRPRAFAQKVVDIVEEIARNYSSGELQRRFYSTLRGRKFECRGVFKFYSFDSAKAHLDFALRSKDFGEHLNGFPFFKFDMNSAQVWEWMRRFIEPKLDFLKDLKLDGDQPNLDKEMSVRLYVNQQPRNYDPVLSLDLDFILAAS